MGLETGLLVGSALLGTAGTAYGARQQKLAQKQAEATARDTARRSQTQQGVNVDQFRAARNARRGRSFDPVTETMMPAGGNLLGG